MRFLYVTDLHGDINKYEKILNIAINEDIKLIVNGGDMLVKINDRFKVQPQFINDYLNDYFKRIKEHNINYICMLGNDDLASLDQMFDDVCNTHDNVYNIAQRKVVIDEYEFIGMNYILDHPFGCKDRVVMEDNYVHQRQLMSYALLSQDGYYDRIDDWFTYAKTKLPKMKDILNNLPKPINNTKTIYLTHIAPANLRLGQLLYQDLDIGSIDILNFLKKQKPFLTLHGHIHESPDTYKGIWLNKIGDTICINPGQTELNSSTLIYAYIDTDELIFTRKKANIYSE